MTLTRLVLLKIDEESAHYQSRLFGVCIHICTTKFVQRPMMRALLIHITRDREPAVTMRRIFSSKLWKGPCQHSSEDISMYIWSYDVLPHIIYMRGFPLLIGTVCFVNITTKIEMVVNIIIPTYYNIIIIDT